MKECNLQCKASRLVTHYILSIAAAFLFYASGQNSNTPGLKTSTLEIKSIAPY